MSGLPKTVRLSSGYDMPLIGLGTGGERNRPHTGDTRQINRLSPARVAAGAGESVNAFTQATEEAIKAGYG